MSLLGVLFLIFLVLKCAGVIAWSWWWVCSPLIVMGVFGIVYGYCCYRVLTR